MDSIRAKLLKRDTKLPLSDAEPVKQGRFYNARDNLRETEYIFDFFEPTLDLKPENLSVFGLGNGYFSVNEVWYPGSIMVFPT